MLYIYDSFGLKRKYFQSRKIEYVVISSAQISLTKTKLKQKLIHKKCLKGCASTGGHTIQQRVYDNDSCIRIEALWLVEHLEVCLGEGAKERSEVLPFRDTFCLQLPRFSCETNTATIILLCNINTVRLFSLNYLF